MHERRMPVDLPEATIEAARASNRKKHRGREPYWRRLHRRLFHRQISRTRHTMLPVLIQVFAGFSKVDGEIEEREIDQSLGFLRYDYPETVYSELRQLYRAALREPQDLNEIATDLSQKLPLEEKVLLGVQLYALISRAELQKDHLIAFYLFMTNLGIASEAIDIVYQLNASELEEATTSQEAGHPLETILFGRQKPADVVLPMLSESNSVMCFRFQELILLKNLGSDPVLVRGRQIREGEFVRLFDGQRVLVGEMVLDYQDIIFYFNSKKSVSSTRIYLSFNNQNSPYVEKARTSRSHLEVRFGLGIMVRALKSTQAELNGIRLRAGKRVEASLRDKIIFDDRTEIAMTDLRRRARILGGRFDLNPTRSEYLVSNNPVLLREGDILLSTGTSGEILLRITCNYEMKTGELEVVKSDRPIFIEEFPVRFRAFLKDGDTITIGDGQFLRCHFSDGIIEEERNVISTLQVQDLGLAYDRKSQALDNISLKIQRGEMVCVMGPSGCGKSTLMKCLAGHLQPTEGSIKLNGVDLYASQRDRKRLTPYISFIPHDLATDPLLTVEENLDFAAAIRAPHFSDSDRKRRADARLVELGLSELRHRVSGDDHQKNLSGGQRKRLNAGLDMIGISDVYLFDEPTSGLSSKDSEHVLEIIRGLSHNKIILVSIHQPSARLFHMFHKAILLDHGGKLAFYGTPQQMLDYFHRVQVDESMRMDSETDLPAPTQPDFIFDVLETPLRDLSGDVIYEEDNRGQLAPSRRFSPNFWRDRFQTYRLIEEVQVQQIGDASASDTPAPTRSAKPPPAPARTKRDDWVHFSTLFKRSFLSKLRNRSNLTTTLLQAPLLALLVSFVLRYTEEGSYNFANAFHIPTYLFLTLVIGMFLGLTNSADEILRDRILLQRERNHRLRVGHYIWAKVLALSVFALVQCTIYTIIGHIVLSIRHMFWEDLLWMYGTTMLGVVIGLFISSVVPNSKTALNVIPLVLIPQIILGGALIKYEEMNRSFDFIHAARNWIYPASDEEPPSKFKVPEVCQFMPLRWSYEGMIIDHAQSNPISSLKMEIDNRIQQLVKIEEMSDAEADELDNYKMGMAVLSGMEADSAGQLLDQLKALRTSLREGTFEVEDFEPRDYPEDAITVTGEELFLNRKIQDLFKQAEFERLDYRFKTRPNVFFGAEKQFHVRWWNEEGQLQKYTLNVRTTLLDALVLVVFGAISMLALFYSVQRQMRRV